jgi:6-phosphofructo-2-kinase/fructose-2,6-biphosphatase 4
METYPDEWERFLADPYAHRAPRAESYHDLSGMSILPLNTRKLLMSVRLEPIIFELERVQEDMLVIGHASVIRCLVSRLTRTRGAS